MFEVCVFCVFLLNSSGQLGAVSAFTSSFSYVKLCLDTRKIHTKLNLCSKISITLEQIHFFKTRVTAELTV